MARAAAVAQRANPVELLIDFYNKLPYTLDTERFRFPDEVPALESGHFHRGFS